VGDLDGDGEFAVYDFDGVGKAEVVLKSAEGTIDGKGFR
jgi:hypothetical protein